MTTVVLYIDDDREDGSRPQLFAVVSTAHPSKGDEVVLGTDGAYRVDGVSYHLDGLNDQVTIRVFLKRQSIAGF